MDLSQLLYAIYIAISQTLSYLQGYIAQVVYAISGMVANVLSSLFAFVQGMVQSVMQALQNALSAIAQAISGIIDQVIGVIASLVERIRNFFEGVLIYLFNLMSDVAASVQALMQAVLTEVRDFIDGVVQFVRDVIDDLAEYLRELFGDIRDIVEDLLTEIVDIARRVIDGVVELVQAAWEMLVTGAQTIIDSINERIADLSTAFEEAFERLTSGIEGIAEDTLGPMRDAVKAMADVFKGMLDTQGAASLRAILDVVVAPHSLALRTREQAEGLFRAIVPQNGPMAWVFMLIFGVITVARVFGLIMDANAKVMSQSFSTTFAHEILSPADIIQAWRKGAIQDGDAKHRLTQHGFSIEDAGVLISTNGGPPALGEVVQMLLRRIITDDKFRAALKAMGLDLAWEADIRKLAEIIPPVSDLITMAVREAFSPQVIARFGLHEDFPEQFAEQAKLVGLSETWAKAYWAAHWSLPSPTQGFEMYHRGIIERPDLELLLRALDITPFWRDALIKLAYNPLGRVDIRRMHAVGVLDEPGVRRAYLDLGYSPDDATRLTEFTLRLNKYPSQSDDDELGRLTRGAILGFFEDGLLQRPRAVELLQAGGHTPEGANLYVSSVEHDIERRERKLEIDTVIDLVSAGILTVEEADLRLRALGLADLEIERALARLQRAAATKTKLPSVEQGVKMFAARIITEQVFRDLLARLGYAASWRDAFVSLARRSAALES